MTAMRETEEWRQNYEDALERALDGAKLIAREIGGLLGARARGEVAHAVGDVAGLVEAVRADVAEARRHLLAGAEQTAACSGALGKNCAGDELRDVVGVEADVRLASRALHELCCRMAAIRRGARAISARAERNQGRAGAQR